MCGMAPYDTAQADYVSHAWLSADLAGMQLSSEGDVA
jgi:hypothetical protein